MKYPNPKNDFLKDIVECFRKRGKALKYKLNSIDMDRVIIKDGELETERLEVEIIIYKLPKKMQLSLFIWEDRWLWVDARRWGNNTWDWGWSYEGRLLPIYSGRDIVSAVEQTISKTYNINKNNVRRLDSIWQEMIALGPVEVEFHRCSE